MNAIQRFTFRALLPPLGAGFLSFGVLMFATGASFSWDRALPGLLFVTFFVYVIALIPSIGYAVVMELAIWFGLRPGRGPAILLSAVLGGLAGALPFIGGRVWRDWQTMNFPIVVGFVVGLVVEGWIGRLGARPDRE